MSEFHNHSNDDESVTHCPICDHPLAPGMNWLDCPNCEVEWELAPDFEVVDLDEPASEFDHHEPGDDVANLPTAIGAAIGFGVLAWPSL